MSRIKPLILIASAAMLLSACGSQSSSSVSSSQEPPASSEVSSSESTPASSSTSTPTSSVEPSSSTSTSSDTSTSSSSSSSESSSSSQVQKATIALGTISHASTSLKAGDYELNQAISFTVEADDEYNITEVKMNDVALTKTGNSYSFTPTEQKTYTLTVTTEEIENLVVFNFNDGENLIHKGIQIDPNTLNPGEYPEIKDGVITLKEGMRIVVNCRATGTKDVWMRKITFVFKEGSDKFAPTEEEDKGKYKDGVWTETMVERTDRGTGNLPCLASGKVVIDKIIVETTPFAAYKTKITFTGLESDEKIYVTKEPTQTGYETKIEYKPDMEFTLSDFYYFIVASNEKHKKYYELPDIVNAKDSGLVYTDTYIEDPNTHQQFHVRFYRIDIPEDIVESIPLTVKWTGKNAAKSIHFNDEKGNEFVKGYMETKPMESLDLQESDFVYGKEVKIYDLRPKNGYRDLKLIFNGKEIEPSGESGRIFSFVVDEKDENIISFTAIKGEDPRITKVNISEKGYIFGAEIEGLFNFEFQQAEDHPSAKLETLKFNDVIVEGKEIDEHMRYILSAEQTAAFKAAEDKVSLFTASITEDGVYQSALSINKGAYTIKVEYLDGTYKEVQGEEEGKINAYPLNGGVQARVTITPNINLEIFAIDVNDKRLESSAYTKDEQTGVITYNFTVNRAAIDMLIQTVPQKVTLNANITAGYKVVGLSDSPVNVGEELKLKLAPTDDEHYLFGKNVTITYNNQNVPATGEEFDFIIVPVKGVATINVVIADAPQQ